ILDAARPLDVERRDGGVLREAERDREIALRRVAGSTADDAPLPAAGALDADDGADAVLVRLRADRAHAEEVVPVAAVVAIQARRPVVGREQDVEVAVAIVVGVRGAARDDRPHELRADRLARVLELLLSDVAEQERRLLELDLRLNASDLLLDVAVRRED